jgi:hypothetical protein
VAYQCETIEDAYRRRREAIHLGNADEHIELARWCVRYGLWSAAAGELADAMGADPRNPAIPHLERQLKAELEPLPLPPAGGETARTSGPTRGELDQLIRRVPSGSVETFTGTIQPLLVNSCATGGCHGPQSAGRLRLLRGRSGSPPGRRVTLANLHATLACIDRDRPENSPLLVEAIRAHGTAAKPALNSGDEQKYRQIVAWVLSVAAADRPRESGPQTIDAGQPAVANVAPAAAGAPLPAGRPSAANGANRPASFGPAVAPGVPAGRAADSTIQRGAATGQFVPADPFDPEIFNRQYHGDK